MTNPAFKGHSAAWIAGYKDAERQARGQQIAYDLDLWLQEQYRIDHDAWIWTQGVIVGCLLVLVTYWVAHIW